MWQCEACLRTTSRPKSHPNGCGTTPLKFLDAMRNPRGHHLWIGRLVNPKDDPQFIYCAKCAHYGSIRSVKGLAKPCRGSPGSPSYQRFARLFSQGNHPLYGSFEKPWPLEIYTYAAAETQQCTYEEITPFVPQRQPFGFDAEDWDLPAVGQRPDGEVSDSD